MKQVYLMFVGGVLLVSSCKKQAKLTDSTIQDIEVNSVDSLLPADCIPANFTTPMGTRVSYTKVGDAVKLSWGDGMYIHNYDSLFVCRLDNSGLWDYIPKYVSETKKNLVFTNVTATSGGGNPDPIEFCAIIFPKNTADSIYEKNYFLDKYDDYIIYLPGGHAGVIEILNIESGKSQQCILDPQPRQFSKSPIWIISKTEVSAKNLKVDYIWLDDEDNEITAKNTFKLKV